MWKPTGNNKAAQSRWARHEAERNWKLDNESMRTYCGHCGAHTEGLMRANNAWWAEHRCNAGMVHQAAKRGRGRARKRRSY